MPDQEASPFIPTELWTPDAETFDLGAPIHQALDEINGKHPGHLIETLQKSVEHSESGIAYAVLRGDNPGEYSDSEALVMINPFANAATPNMLVRAEFIREVAQFSDVRDAQGKLKPVVMLASPGINGSKLRLTRDERHELRSGELGPVARELLHAVSEQEIGRVTLLGFSQGADLALAGARSAYGANLDTHAVAIGDPAGVADRTMPQLAGDFFKAGTKDLKLAVAATGLEAQQAALGTGAVDFMRFGASVLRPTNLHLYHALGANTFETRVQQILDEGVIDKLVIGYGGDSAIAKPEAIEPALQHLYDVNGADSLISIKVAGGKHMWGDQLTLLSKLYMQAATGSARS